MRKLIYLLSNDDILTEIMAVYSGTIINNGMPVLQAIALRMTIALVAIEGGYKIAMELYSGDKIKFIVATCFKVGFFCFLISEWLDIGQALSGFFQTAGFLVAGESGFSTATPESADFDKTFRPDSIWHNAWAFLSNSAISLMFNSGAKMMVICFLQVMIAKIYSAYFSNLTANPFKEFSVLCQITIMSIFFLYIVKKIPELVSSFLNGSPALSGGGMIQQAKSTVAQAGMVVGAGAGALAGTAGAASAMSTMKGAMATGKMSALKALPTAARQLAGGLPQAGGNLLRTGAAAALTSNPLADGFAKGAKMVVGSDGTMANKGILRKAQDMAGLTNQGHEPILGKAAENASDSSKEKKDEKSGGGNGKGESTDRATALYPTNGNTESKKQTVNNIFQNSTMMENKNNSNHATVQAPGSQQTSSQPTNSTTLNSVSTQDTKNGNSLYNMGNPNVSIQQNSPQGISSQQPSMPKSDSSSINQFANNVNNQYAVNIHDTKNASSITNVSNLNK